MHAMEKVTGLELVTRSFPSLHHQEMLHFLKSTPTLEQTKNDL